jgi:hypothetical protein
VRDLALSVVANRGIGDFDDQQHVAVHGQPGACSSVSRTTQATWGPPARPRHGGGWGHRASSVGRGLRPVAVTREELRRTWRRRGSLVRRAAADAVGVYGSTLADLAGR